MGGGIDQGDNSARGALTVTARVSNGASRYAMPTLPTLTYAALLYEDGNPPATPPSEDFIEGTKATNSDNLIFSFQRPEKTDGIKFTLEVFAFAKADAVADDGTTTFSRGSALFSGGKDGLAIEGDEIKVTDPIALSSSKSGTVNLKITVPADCLLEIDDTAKAKFKCERESETPNTYSITASEISAGAYPVTFTVKKEAETVHVFTESINVINGLCTDTWSGREKGEAKVITQSAISSTVYVRGVGGWYDTHSPYNDGATATASDDNLGSFSSPFATIQKAIDKVIAINDGESEYTIKIDGTLTQSTAVENMAKISPSENLNLTIESMSADTNATLDAANNGRVMYTGGKANVKLKNIHMTGGCNINSNNGGGGIYNYDASVNVELFNVTISNCTVTSAYGGGICNFNGTFIITDSTITNCMTTNSGGGIWSAGTLTVTGGEISNCSTLGGSTGSNGGGVCNAGKLTMSGVSIKNCSATTSGGGIYNSVSDASITSTITNCTITDCTVSSSSNYGGGGISNNTGKLELTNVDITGRNDTANPDANNGGGIYNSTNGTFKMTGGAITGCNAGSTASGQGGGGIYNHGTFKLSGVTISDCSADAFGGGILTKGSSTENIIKDCTITDCKVQGTTANNVGGGICVYSASLTVEGGTISGCVASGSGSGSGGGVFISNGASAEIKGCTITSCKAMNGGGINNQGTLTVTEGTNISACTGYGAVYNWKTLTVTGGTKIFDCTNAGGIKNASGKLTVDDCTISNCTYSDFGGIYITKNSTSAKISNCTITDCHADTTANNVGNGGGINNELASTEIEDCTITNCTAIHSGGGIYNNVSDDTVTTKITNCTISGCKAKGTTSTSGGGGIYVSSGALELTGVTITGGNDVENPDARLGGGIFVNGGMLTMTGGEISNCTATNSGGGVYIGSSGTFKMSGTAKITGCKTKATTGGTGGGGIYSLGALTVTGGTISDCIAGRSGGGIYAYGGTVECSGGVAFSNCETTGSGSVGSGGGMCINSGVTVNVSDCTFTLCKAKASGGGIWNAGVLAVSNTSFTNCSAGSKGGGICNDGGTVAPTNITYSGCTAPTDSDKSGF